VALRILAFHKRLSSFFSSLARVFNGKKNHSRLLRQDIQEKDRHSERTGASLNGATAADDAPINVPAGAKELPESTELLAGLPEQLSQHPMP